MKYLFNSFAFFVNKLPNDLMRLFNLENDIQSTCFSLRGAKNLFYLPSIKTKTHGNKSIRYRCAEVWNRFIESGLKTSDTKSKSLEKIRDSTHLKNVLQKYHLYNYSVEN